MKIPSAAIFDLDGTLLDTLQDLADSANEALSAAGLPVHPVDAYRTFVGDGIHMLVQRILPANRCDDETVAQVLALYRAAYGRRWDNRTRPYPAIPEMLHELSFKPVKLAVLSNKPQKFTELCITHHLPGNPFHLIYGQRENLPRKPDPAGALEIAHEILHILGRRRLAGDGRTLGPTGQVRTLWSWSRRNDEGPVGDGGLGRRRRICLRHRGRGKQRCKQTA